MGENKNLSLKVLVVEDETIIAINICNSLQQFGYRAEFSNTGEAAIEILREKDFDIVLMDIMLGSGMDGIETASEMQKIREIPIVYLTAYSDPNTLSRAQDTDPSGYIIKPFHSRELFISIELAIYKYKSAKSLREMQDRLYESQRMESLGMLSSGIAHEINNPLMGIVNFSEMGLEKAQELESPELENYFRTIQDGANRIALIVRNLINYAREDRDHWIWADMKSLVGEILSLFHQLFIKEKIRTILENPEDIPEIYCKPQRLKQSILNIITYCRLSLQEKPNRKEEESIEICIHYDTPKDELTLEFSLDGENVFRNIRESEEGYRELNIKNFSHAGLGFFLSQTVAEEHGGNIEILSNQGKSLLRLKLPRMPEK